MSMLQQFVKLTISNNLKNTLLQYNKTNIFISKKRFLSFTSLEYNEQKDPRPLFFNKDVQKLLKTLTRTDLNRVYRKRKLGEKTLETPTYKFMTDEQLQEIITDATNKAEELLQMPPVVPQYVSPNHIYSEDPALQKYDAANFVFTDISYGVKDKDRVIIVRDTNGSLKDADLDIRNRMNQMYFPKIGRSLIAPRMFQGKLFEELLNKEHYEFILDRACVQYEPDDPEYQRVTSITYQHLNSSSAFDSVRSTRHFGPCSFFLTWFKIPDNLLLNLIETAHINEAQSLVDLYSKVHDVEFKSDKDSNKIDKFIEQFASKRGPLELAMQAYREFEKQQAQFQQGLDKAHGRV